VKWVALEDGEDDEDVEVEDLEEQE